MALRTRRCRLKSGRASGRTKPVAEVTLAAWAADGTMRQPTILGSGANKRSANVTCESGSVGQNR
jgi:hypothetical protein